MTRVSSNAHQVYGVFVFVGVAAGFITGEGFIAGEALAVGDALAAGKAFITGDALSDGDGFGDGDVAPFITGMDAPATTCH